MNVYLITVDDIQEGRECYVCATSTAADKLFQKIVKERYFEPGIDAKEDLTEACDHWFWQSRYGDVIECLEYHVLNEDEV